MTDQIQALVESAVVSLDPLARDVIVRSQREIPVGQAIPVQVSWESRGATHLQQLVVKREAVPESRLLIALAGTDVPVPTVLSVVGGETERAFAIAPVSGQRADEALRAAEAPWQISALAFTFARMLARIHRLDWTLVAPWLGDPDSLPEDLVDEQVDAMRLALEGRVVDLPPAERGRGQRALAWLDDHRPVEVSVCLCHGDYRPRSVVLADDEVRAVVDWDRARVTDAAYDLALLPFEARRAGLDREASELFARAALGAYLQASPRSLGNLAFYTVARLLERAVEAEGLVEREEWLASMERAMASGGQVPWRG
ncbi:MAG: phosphotransferase [Thermomicrobiaceae bacterium]|nr:phosphotransferase [Thermomicrobiaceae bacterium]